MAAAGGKFNYKEGKFTTALNSVISDPRMSMRALGLYMKIEKDLHNPFVDLTKSYLQSQCTEGETAFESAWKELKALGYLKTHMRPSKKGSSFEITHELLYEPEEGPNTFWYDAKGNVTRTDLDAKALNAVNKVDPEDRKARKKERHEAAVMERHSKEKPENVQWVENHPIGNHPDGDHPIADEPHNINPKTIYKTDSSIYDVHSDVIYLMQDDVLNKIDRTYIKEIPLIKAALNALVNRKSRITFQGETINRSDILERLDSLPSKEVLAGIINETLRSYRDYASKNEVKSERTLLQSIFWDKLSSYAEKKEAFRETKNDDEWDRILKAVSRYGRTKSAMAKAELGEVTWQKIKAIGGFQKICNASPTELKELRNSYMSL